MKRSLEEKLGSLDEEILELTPEDAIEAEIIQADEVKERIYAALSKMDNRVTHTPTSRTDPPAVDQPIVDPPAIDPPIVDPPAVDPRLLLTRLSQIHLPLTHLNLHSPDLPVPFQEPR